MKTIVLWSSALLLATLTLTGCSSGDDDQNSAAVVQPQTGNNDQGGPNAPTNNEDEGGIFDLPDVQTLDAAMLNACVVGKGWKHAESHLVNKDGKTCQGWDYWKGMIGASPSNYAFTDEVFTQFFTSNAHAMLPCYTDRRWHYDEQTNIMSIEEGSQKIKVLSASETELHIILVDCAEGSDENGEYRKLSLYSVYNVMADSELQEARDKFWVNSDDLNRKMTPEDLQHKWVLTQYTDDQSIMRFVGDNRSDDKNYIRFAADGTFVGRANGTEFSGKYKYNGSQIVLTPDASVEQGSDYFIKNVWKVKKAKITAAASLSLEIGNENCFYFIRGKE